MKNLWNDKEAAAFSKNLLVMRVYTSRLLGQEEDLVLHGGGNTSVKVKEKNIFGVEEDILYVKGSGWDLGTIEAAGFAPVKLAALIDLAQLSALSDLEMVKYQRMAMTNPSAPNPSVEAILHAIIPFTFVDHTHADAVVTITNSPNGKQQIQEIYGQNMLIVPYVMPGFILAKKIYDMTKNVDWDKLDGMILLNHGVFTFDNDAKKSYQKMIDIVSAAEKYLKRQKAIGLKGMKSQKEFSLSSLVQIRRSISEIAGEAMLSRLSQEPMTVSFSAQPNVKSIAGKGPLTPDHIIRTKRIPAILSDSFSRDLDKYVEDYKTYYNKFNKREKALDPAPRWAILPGIGTLSIGNSASAVGIISDITRHTMKAITQAEQLGGWRALPARDLFEMEYWSLEQAKLAKAGTRKSFQGKIALVTGAASGIGKACVEEFVRHGGAVIALDINPAIKSSFSSSAVLGLVCDITKSSDIDKAISEGIRWYGGIDHLISNAGIFPPSRRIEDMDESTWQKSLELNLSSHQRLLQKCIPFLKEGINPSVVFIGSKNVPAPGPGAVAYSAAKAGLTQLARVAALELGEYGIRVNTLHPNAVYDTGIWTDDVLSARAKHYGLTIQEYKTNNVLKKEVKSTDVAALTVAMLGSLFGTITGAQLPIDGGNERVI